MFIDFRERTRERERERSISWLPPQPMTHVLCYDLTAAVTSLGNRNSSAPLSSYGATITLGPSTDWNAMLHLTVVTLLQSLEYPIRVSHPIFNWFTFLCNSVGFQKKKNGNDSIFVSLGSSGDQKHEVNVDGPSLPQESLGEGAFVGPPAPDDPTHSWGSSTRICASIRTSFCSVSAFPSLLSIPVLG